MSRHRAQLFLDRLECTPQRRPARQRIGQIQHTRIEPHRIKTGEPAHRPCQVDAREHLFLAAVTLQIDQHRMADDMADMAYGSVARGTPSMMTCNLMTRGMICNAPCRSAGPAPLAMIQFATTQSAITPRTIPPAPVRNRDRKRAQQ